METTSEGNSGQHEEHGLAQDFGTAIVVGTGGGAGVEIGKALGHSAIDKVSGVLGKKEPPSQVVLPPGTGDK